MYNIKSLFNISPTPLQKLEDDFLIRHKINLFVKREDLNDDELSGNKLHKLKHNLLKARELGFNNLLTFGGAYSNHIYATAAAGKRFGFDTIGVIRGEEHLPLNPTLQFAKSCKMNLFYLNRNDYRKKHTEDIINQLKNQFGEFYLIPEGGTNELAVKGCKDIVKPINIDYDFICLACGTGGTFSGIVAGLNGKRKALGFAVLKNAKFLNDDVIKLLASINCSHLSNWEINLNYHFGGYAKINTELIDFIKRFEANNNIQIEPIYTGKLFFGIYDLIKNNYFAPGTTIIAVHTGGLQGRAGFNKVF